MVTNSEYTQRLNPDEDDADSCYILSKEFFKEIVTVIEPFIKLIQNESSTRCSYWDDNGWPKKYANHIDFLSNPFSPENNQCSNPTYKAVKLYKISESILYCLDDFDYEETYEVLYECSY